jgi:hypothetical protein
VIGHELDVSKFKTPVRRRELDAKVGQLEVTLNNGQPCRRRKLLQVVRAVFVRSLWTIEERLVITLEFVVEDDALDSAALALNFLSLGLKQAINLGVMGDLSRLDEARVELLRAACDWHAMRFQQVLAALGEDSHGHGFAIDLDRSKLQQSLLSERPEITVPRVSRRADRL